MDVIINYGINFKKCTKESYSGYKRSALISYIEKNLIEKNAELVFSILAEIHCSSYYKDLQNIIISHYSQYNILYNITFAFFIDNYFQKIIDIKKTIPKSQQNNALINSNEMRNIYTSIFSNLISTKNHHILNKLPKNSHQPDYYLQYCKLKTFHPIVDSNNLQLTDQMSRGLREILFYSDIQVNDIEGKISKLLNTSNLEKINFWINWCFKIESIEKKFNKNKLYFTSKYKALKNLKYNHFWEYFIWDKIWQKCEKNKFINKKLFKSFTNIFFTNYTHNKVKERCNILAVSLLLSNSRLQIPIKRHISKEEIFANLNANKFYKNIISPDEQQNYLTIYNNYNDIHKKDKTNNKKIYKQNKMEDKMSYLHNYIPKLNNEAKKIDEYFSNK